MLKRDELQNKPRFEGCSKSLVQCNNNITHYKHENYYTDSCAIC